MSWPTEDLDLVSREDGVMGAALAPILVIDLPPSIRRRSPEPAERALRYPSARETLPMKLDQLTPPELLALVGLLKLVVRADGRLSDEELDSLEAFGQEAGIDAWVTAVDEAEETLPTRDLVLQHAAALERIEVRHEIMGRLRDVAGTDGITEQEAAVLTLVEALWDLA